jgi:hypothetical protein
MPLLVEERAKSLDLRTRHRQTVKAISVSFAIYTLIAIVCFWKIWSTHPTSVAQIGGDQFSTMWFLKWVPFAILHGHNPMFSNYANYPYGVNTLNNTGVPLLGVAAAPITWIFGPIASYSALQTVALSLSATSGFLFVRRWTVYRSAAFVGGLLYGFSPYEMAQSLGHLNLTFVVFPPLILLGLHEIVVRQNASARRWGIALGLMLVGQFFISSEVLVSTVVIGIVALAAAIIVGRRTVRAHLRHAAEGIAWSLGLVVVILAYPVWFMLRGPQHIQGRIQLEPQAYRADLLGPLLPDQMMRLAPSFSTRLADTFANSVAENGSYLGVTLLVALLITVIVYWRSSVVRVAAITGIGAFILSLGGNLVIMHRPQGPIGLPLPEKIFTHLPLLNNTVPARYAAYVALMAALIFGILIDQLILIFDSRSSGTRRFYRFIPAAVAVLALVPLIPSIPLSGIATVTTPRYFSSPAMERLGSNTVTILVPYPSTPFPYAQVWQASSGMRFKMPGGYYLVPEGPEKNVAYSPVLLYTQNTLMARTLVYLADGMPPAETPALQQSLRDQLRAWRVSNVIAAQDAVTNPAQSVQFLTWMIGKGPVSQDGVYAWYKVST